MKRLIKYHSPYNELEFSDCSTRYEVLPVVFSDDVKNSEIRKAAKKLGIELQGNIKKLTDSDQSLVITHCVNTTNEIEGDGMYSDEKYQERLGLINIRMIKGLPLQVTVGNKLTEEQAYALVNDQECGIDSVAETVDDEVVMIKQSWGYYHYLPVLGYSLEHFEELLGITEHGFSDDTFICGNCGKADSRDDGYTYNYKVVDCELLGRNCGCVEEYEEENYNEFIVTQDDLNSGDLKNIDGELAKKLAEKGVLKELGNSSAGWYRHNSNPHTFLQGFLDKGLTIVVGIDGVGQWETNYTVYQVLK